MRLVFLDFDGVLHPAPTKPGASLPFEWVAQLTALLSQAPDVGIAVHSSWAQRFELEHLRDFLGPLGSRVVGRVEPGFKASSILHFLQLKPDVTCWIVLDDDGREFPPSFPGRVIVCDPARGISDLAVQEQVRRWLALPGHPVAKSAPLGASNATSA